MLARGQRAKSFALGRQPRVQAVQQLWAEPRDSECLGQPVLRVGLGGDQPPLVKRPDDGDGVARIDSCPGGDVRLPQALPRGKNRQTANSLCVGSWAFK